MSSRQKSRRRSFCPALFESLETRVLMSVTLDNLPAIYGSSITLPAGKSIVIPLTATSTLAGQLTYTVTASSPSLVPVLNSLKPAVSATRTIIRMSTSMGNMDFQLFNDIAPITVSYLLSHINSADFTNSPIFRIIQQDLGAGNLGSFIQAGDRNGDGISNLPGLNIQQELDPRLIYDGHGQLAEARTNLPDSGNSEFFVTLETQRSFDFNYSIYGQMLRGWDVLTAIDSLPTDVNDHPLSPPTLLGISVIQDPTDAVLTLGSTSGTPLSGTITVTAHDAFGHSDSKVFNVNTVTDTFNDPPFLNPPSMVNRAIPKNTVTAISFGSATDIDGDPITITGPFSVTTPSHFLAALNSTKTGLLVQPVAGYSGPVEIVVQAAQTSNSSNSTARLYTFYVDSGAAPTATAGTQDVYAAAGGTYTFTVTYNDDTLVDVSKIIGNNSQVTVMGPNGYAAAARYVSIDSAAAGPTRTVTYRVTAPGGSWNAADAGAYTINIKGGVVKDTLGHAMAARAMGTFYYSPSAFFDERYYLAMNPDIAAAVKKHTYTSGWQQFNLVGQKQGRPASPYFNEKLYLTLYPDVAAAVRKGQIKSGWQHFVTSGAREGRIASPVFNEKQYLAMYPDVAAAVAHKTVNSGFEHFILHGQFEGRNPSAYFSLTNYAALYPSLVTAVANGTAGVARTLTEHFLIYGQKEGRTADSLFNESYYLSTYPDVAAAVAKGQFKSGFEHFILFGAAEGRNPSTGFNSNFYLATYPDVVTAIANHVYSSAFEHYLLVGLGEGRTPHA